MPPLGLTVGRAHSGLAPSPSKLDDDPLNRSCLALESFGPRKVLIDGVSRRDLGRVVLAVHTDVIQHDILSVGGTNGEIWTEYANVPNGSVHEGDIALPPALSPLVLCAGSR